jgi:dUTP pyrophosphatase
MNKRKINIKRLNSEAIIPTYGTEYSAGMDLYADHSTMKIYPGETAFVHTGITMEIPEGHVGLVFARSSLATQRGLAPANKVGVIDSDYRGEIIVALHNASAERQRVLAGERVAQMVIMPYVKAELEEVDELTDTVRGTGGFGSTGK